MSGKVKTKLKESLHFDQLQINILSFTSKAAKSIICPHSLRTAPFCWNVLYWFSYWTKLSLRITFDVIFWGKTSCNIFAPTVVMSVLFKAWKSRLVFERSCFSENTTAGAVTKRPVRRNLLFLRLRWSGNRIWEDVSIHASHNTLCSFKGICSIRNQPTASSEPATTLQE